MTYLLDTDVISALAPRAQPASVDVVAWLETVPADLYTSVITVAEIRDGIAKAGREGASRKAGDLAAWWDAVEHLYGDRILPFCREAATIAGALTERARGRGQAPGFSDIAIAAIAQLHGLTVLTRNTRHFQSVGVEILNPFEARPSHPGTR